MRFLGVGFSTILFLLAVVGGVGVAPVAAAEPQAAAPAVAAEKEKPQNEKSVVEPIPWPEKYDPRTLKPIRLFMTGKEVREMWGEPARYLYGHIEKNLKIRKYISVDAYEEALKRYGPLADVYYRKTPTNRYEILVDYKQTKRQGPGKLEMNVSHVAFIPATRFPVNQTLNEIAEAAVVCPASCGIIGAMTGIYVRAYPRYPTLFQQEAADLMARIWKPDLYKRSEGKRNWVSELNLWLEWSIRDLSRDVQEIEWFQRPVKTITLTISTPQMDLELEKKTSSYGESQRLLQLGSYTSSME